MPDTAANKALMQIVFSALAEGDGRSFVDAMAEDFTWTIEGSGPWGRSWRGKRAVREQLLAPLFAQFATRYRNRAERFIAEGAFVVVQCRGEVATHAGEAYNNSYCQVCRFHDDGTLAELTEYMDTALCEAVLDPPEPEVSAA